MPAAALVAGFAALALLLHGSDEAGPSLAVGIAVGAVALVVAWFGTRPVDLRLGDEGIARLGGRRPPVRYGDLCYVAFTGRADAARRGEGRARYLVLAHPRGVWRVPRAPGLDRDELRRHVLDLMRRQRSAEALPGGLEAVRAREEARFGPDKVLASTGRPLSPGEFRRTRWIACLAVGWGIDAALGRAVGFSPRSAGALGAFAFLAACAALTVWWLETARRARIARLRPTSGIVVTPRGLTLEGPDLRGELLWEEVEGSKEVDARSPLRRSLRLAVPGTTVVVTDRYRVPLAEIAAAVETWLSRG